MKWELRGAIVCNEIFELQIGKFLLPKAAAVQWASMKPEFNPPSWTRKAGSSLYAKRKRW